MLQSIIDTFVDQYLTAKGDKESTLRWYRTRLGQFRRWMEAENPHLEKHHLEDDGLLTAYVALLYARGLKVQTVNGHIRILRAFYKYMVARRVIQHNAAQCLHKKRDPHRVPKAISRRVRKQILDTAYRMEGAYSNRNYALLLLLADSGARAGEICSITLDMLNLERLETIVSGKSGQRVVVFSPQSRTALQTYMDTERRAAHTRLVDLGLIEPDGPQSRYLWLGHKGPLTYWGVRMVLRRVVDKAREQVQQNLEQEISLCPTNAHSFRHAFARDVLQNGGDLTEVRDHLGHKDITVTQMYSCWTVGERHRLHGDHTEVAAEAAKRTKRE